jgi:hypothetical protein
MVLRKESKAVDKSNERKSYRHALCVGFDGLVSQADEETLSTQLTYLRSSHHSTPHIRA